MHHIDDASKFKAEEDKLVVVSRITQAEVEDTIKYPIFMPTNHRITDLIITEAMASTMLLRASVSDGGYQELDIG